METPNKDTPRIKRLKSGNWAFGHDSRHRGLGTEECPTNFHHHCDAFCKRPTKQELEAAGIDPKDFKMKSRRNESRKE